MSSNTVPGKKIANLLRAKESARSKPLKLTMFANFPDPNAQGISMKQVWQVLGASLAIATYAEKDLCVRKFFYTLLCAGQSSEALINGGQFLRTALSSTRRGALTMLDITTPSVLKFYIFFTV